MKRLHVVDAGSAEAEATRLALPEHVRLWLAGIAESAKERLLALAVGAGLDIQRPQLKELEGPSVVSDARLCEEDRTGRLNCDKQGQR